MAPQQFLSHALFSVLCVTVTSQGVDLSLDGMVGVGTAAFKMGPTYLGDVWLHTYGMVSAL